MSTDLVLISKDLKSPRKIEDTLLLDAATDGNEDLARRLIERGASVCEADEDGQTALHLAVLNNHETLVRLLIEKGAEIEAPTKDGRKPLYIAAQLGNLLLVETLLFFSANVESFNIHTQTTAFYEAIENDHEDVAKTLLECGADIDAKIPDGRTALCHAVIKGSFKHVEFLLQHGASKKLLEEEGILENLVNGDELDVEVLKILQKAQLVQGPAIIAPKKPLESRFTHVPSLPATKDQTDRLSASRGFEATIVDFFIGDREERVQVSTLVFDILYRVGPEATMGLAKDPKIAETKPKFRWYHLPANNMAWVEVYILSFSKLFGVRVCILSIRRYVNAHQQALVSRLVAERRSGAAMLDEDLKSSLGLSNASGRQYRASTTQSSFMRPLCRSVKSGPNLSFGDSTADHVMLFIPFLHFEIYDAYEEMSSVISEVKSKIEKGRDFPSTLKERAKRIRKARILQGSSRGRRRAGSLDSADDMSLSDTLRGKKAPIRFKDAVGRKFSYPFELAATWAVRSTLLLARMVELIQQSFLHVDVIGPHVAAGHYDLMGPSGEIILPQVWEMLVEPGWVVSMHMWPMLEPPKPTGPFGPPPGLHFNSCGPPPGPPPGHRFHGSPPSAGPPSPFAYPPSADNKHARQTSTRPPRAGPPGPPLAANHGGPPPPPHSNWPGSALEPPPPLPLQSQPRPRGQEPTSQKPPETTMSPGEGTSEPKKMSNSKTKSADGSVPIIINTSGKGNAGKRKKKSASSGVLNFMAGGPSKSSKAKGKQPARSRSKSPEPVEKLAAVKQNLDKDLIMGYLFPKNPGEIPPLQPRRTLDQYFYTHLESTSRRDADQVVFRETLGTSEAKIFMVDQLWLWILNEDIVISCFPQRWQSHLEHEKRPEATASDSEPEEYKLPSRGADQDKGNKTFSHTTGPFETPSKHSLRPPLRPHLRGPPPPPSGLGGHPVVIDLTQGGRPERKKRETPAGVLGWMTGKPAKSSSAKTKSRPDVLNWMSGTANPPEKNPEKEAEEGIHPNDSDKPATVYDSQSQTAAVPALSDSAPPPQTIPPPGPPNRVDNEAPLRYQDTAPAYYGDQLNPKPEQSRDKSRASSDRESKAHPLPSYDPMDVHQKILKHLKGTGRAPITTIYELASLITNTCVNVFDQYSVLDAFQFLDFFERSIGNIIDQEARCLQKFTDSLGEENVILNIKKETELLVEIKDISDELDILQIVLNDQEKIMKDMAEVTADLTEGIIAAANFKDENLCVGNNRVLESHQYRIKKMKKMTETTYQGLQHLLDLKQKQANFSEALSARKQAEHTFEQAKLASEQAAASLELQSLAHAQARLTTEQIQELNKQTTIATEQGEEMARQGEESARQGKTLLTFTIITIIFLPLSFMTSFFAIDFDAFPVNDNGKLPIGFSMKYMLGISGALSIPFIFVALQQDRISGWVKQVNWPPLLIAIGALAVLIVPIALIWTQHLTTGVKVAVTIALLFLAVVAGVAYRLYKMVEGARYAESESPTLSRSLVDD